MSGFMGGGSWMDIFRLLSPALAGSAPLGPGAGQAGLGLPGAVAAPTPTPFTAPYLDANEIMPGPNTFAQKSWFDRNVGDPIDKAFTADAKTGISPAQKALTGAGSMAGGMAGAPSGQTLGAAAVSGGGYRPAGPMNAAQMALQREQARQLLQQRATLPAPWLKRLQMVQGGGLMG